MSGNGNGASRPTVEDLADALDDVAGRASRYVAAWIALRVSGEPLAEQEIGARLVVEALALLDSSVGEAVDVLEAIDRSIAREGEA